MVAQKNKIILVTTPKYYPFLLICFRFSRDTMTFMVSRENLKHLMLKCGFEGINDRRCVKRMQTQPHYNNKLSCHE